MRESPSDRTALGNRFGEFGGRALEGFRHPDVTLQFRKAFRRICINEREEPW